MRITPGVLLVPFMIAAVGLLTGARWLMLPTPGWASMPLGNLATWLALVCLALLVLDQARNKHRAGLRRVALVLLGLALAWAPLGYLASGNWRFSFSGDDTWLDLGWLDLGWLDLGWLDVSLGPGLSSWWAISGALAALLLFSAAIALVLRPAPGPSVPETP